MTHDNLRFKINYSFFIETMHATLYNRLDKLLTFFQIILGSAVFASYGNSPLFGLFIAVISAFSFVWQPAKAALAYELQAKKMQKLITNNDLPESAVLEAFTKAEETDNPTLGLLRDAAYKRALIATDRVSEASHIKLNLLEKFTAWFAGDFPKT